ncbi:phosphotransferase family protein [Pseudoneobacillus sp. C159]
MNLGALLGRGNTAEVFQMGEKDVIKLFYNFIPNEFIEKEFEISNIIHQLGVPSPQAKKITEHDQRWGIIYERVGGKSFTEILSSKPFSLKKNARYFAELQARFHQKNTIQLPAQKAIFSRHISGTDLLTDDEKETILEYLGKLPEGYQVCHGDYHSDNIVVKDGDAKILDWMTCASGNPYGDVARTFMIMRYSYLSESMPKMTKYSIQLIRKLLCKFYLDSYIKQTGASKEAIFKWMLPVMAARLVEGVPNPEKQFLLVKIREELAALENK